jgi:hypothetical protein
MNPSNLRRSGTLQATAPPHARNNTPPDTTESVEEDEYGYEVEDEGTYDDEYAEYMQQQGQGQNYAASPLGSAGWTPGNEWRAAANSGFSNNGGNGGNQSVAIDEVQRALSALEIASNNHNNSGQMYQTNQNIGNYQAGQSSHPPRFNPAHPPPSQAPGVRGGGNNGNNNSGGRIDIVADLEGRKTPQAQSGVSNYIQQQQYHQQQESRTPSSRGSWDQKDRMLGNRTSNPNLQYGYQQTGKGDSGSGVPNVPPIPQQYLQQLPRMTAGSAFGQGGGVQQQSSGSGQVSGQALMSTPIDVPSLIATKGYNPANFDTRPQFVRQRRITAIQRH